MALYHSAKGSVDYTVVGSPTIVDGVASGFSSSDYLRTTQDFPQSSNPFEMVFKVKFTAVNTTQVLFISNQNLIVAVSGQGHFRLQAQYQNSAWTYSQDGVYSVPVNTDLYIKVLYDGAVFKLSYSTNGISFTDDITISTSTLSFQSGYCLMGTRGNQPLLGYMDLNETYISVNGQPWFGVCPVEVKKHQLMGPVGYTVAGNPTIVDGVASGFSESDYLSLPSLNTAGLNNYEITTCFKTPTSYSNSGGIISTVSSFHSYGLNYSNKLVGTIYANNTYYNIETNSNLLYDTIYYAKFAVNLVNGLISLSTSTDKINWTTETITTTENVQFSDTSISLGIGRSRSGTFTGSIDLNQTYIKVNGKLWFYQPAPTKYIIKDDKLVFASQDLYLTGPVNYTKVGSPAIVDGVASGFSSSDYLKVNNALDTSNNDWEIFTKFKLGQLTSNENVVNFVGTTTRLVVLPSGNPVFVCVFQDSTFHNIQLYTTLESNVYYYSKIKCVNDVITFGVSADKQNWIEMSYTLEKQLRTSYGVAFGCQIFNDVVSGPLGGSIDLNQTYIKVNGSLWFYGKNYATKNIAPVPANYMYGTTTTPSIGYVDMRTQAFTAAPSGATIGRDE